MKLVPIALFTLSSVVLAQDLTVKSAPQKKPVVIRNVAIHTVASGTVMAGTIWFQDGVIRGIHAAAEPADLPRDAEVIDGAGKQVFPGLIAPFTALGLKEFDLVRQSVDLREVGDATPEALAATAVNPDSAILPVTRSNGVLLAGVFPQGGGLVPGRASVIQLDGWTNSELALLPDAGLVVDWPARPEEGGGRRGRRGATEERPSEDRTERSRKRIIELFAQARAWTAARAADPLTPPDVRLQAMAPAVLGKRPTFLIAGQLEQIESALTWALEAGLRPVIVGGRDSLLCKDLLRRHDVPVIVGGTHPLPARADSPYSERFELPARLHQAGVRFCLSSGEEFYNERNLPYAAATAVAWGLDAKVALASITLRSAEILGVADRVGSLEAGKDATLFLADGSPFELTTRIEAAFIQGRRLDLSNKHTVLAEKYRARYRQQTGR